MKNNFKKIVIALAVLLFVGIGAFSIYSLLNKNSDNTTLGLSQPDSQWFVYNNFTGYKTKNDPNKIDDGANPQGQNTSVNNGDRISIRDFGYQIFPSTITASSSAINITSIHTFRKRSGENIMMRAYSTVLEYYDSVSDSWENLNSGYTDSQTFGFSDYNINTDLKSYVYFGNATEPFSRWSGAHTNLNGALAGAEATITVDDTTDGFTTTGTLRICGTDVTYTGKTDTTFTGASNTPACDDNKGVTQAVDASMTSNPRGNIYLVTNNRLFIAGVTSTPQAVYFSKYGDATTYLTTLVTDTTAEDAGIFNLGEGGGGVTGMIEDEGSIYFFKKTAIRKATLSDSLYTLSNLKPFDGRSQTIGSQQNRSVFSGANGIFFITLDNQIMSLQRVENVDYPQVIPISDPIKPTIASAVWDEASGIYWKDKAYFAAKQNSSSNNNDVVFVYNFRISAWESPIIGWNVSDWSIYDDGTGEDLYFASAVSPNIYKITDGPLDDIYGVAANWRSKQYDFGKPEALKEAESVFVEGYIADNTNLTISLLLDENGNTQVYTTTLAGTETTYLFDSPSYNVFGFSAFGTERFGSNDNYSGVRKFRIYLNKDFRPLTFYNAQIEFASDGENQNWEILRYGFAVSEYSSPEARKLYRSFK